MERASRLRKGGEFDTAFSEGTVVSGPLLLLRYRGNGTDVTRWGFAIGKRITKLATERNRTRRRLREIARRLPVKDGYDVIVVGRGGCATATTSELRDALERRLGRAGLLESA